MKFKLLSLAALAFAVSAPALAKDDAKDQAAPKEKKICRTETVTGSLVAKHRICMTQAEWDELAANTRKSIGDVNKRQNLGSESGSGSGSNNTQGFGF